LGEIGPAGEAWTVGATQRPDARETTDPPKTQRWGINVASAKRKHLPEAVDFTFKKIDHTTGGESKSV